MKEFLEAFKALRHAPRALWLVIFAFAFDGMAYFGILPLMKPYLGQDIGIRPELASAWVSAASAALTVIMVFVGRPAERRLGIRSAIVLALALALVGRIFYVGGAFVGGAPLVALALVVFSFGEGVLQPICYAGVKRYTSESTGPMGYALLYAGLNFGAMLVGFVASTVRTHFDVAYVAKESRLSGFNAVNVLCTVVTAVTLVVFALAMTKRVESEEQRTREEPAAGQEAGKSPFTDPRFLFFVFALLPVRTLFAHQWLTMPEYVLRSYPAGVADHMELLVVSVNPLVIFFGVPVLTALTKRVHVLTIMIIGSSVSALSTFLLAFGPNTGMLLAYFVIFSVGEALWTSRFLEYSAELAPPGRVAQYMGVANLPWFVAKMTTGLYSGFVLEAFDPKDGPQRTGTMWFIYGCAACASPALLLLGRRWVLAGMSPAPAK